MISKETWLTAADNSGLLRCKCFHLYGGSHRKFSSLGDFILVSVKKKKNFLHKGKVFLCVITGVRRNISRLSGNYLNFSSNLVLVLSSRDTLLADKLKLPIALEIRKVEAFRIDIFSRFFF